MGVIFASVSRDPTYPTQTIIIKKKMIQSTTSNNKKLYFKI